MEHAEMQGYEVPSKSTLAAKAEVILAISAGINTCYTQSDINRL
jgi:hypothetical protein